MFKKINKTLHTPTWLFVLLSLVMILRIPTFFEPYAYGDEMIYLSLGEAIRQKIPLYKGIHDNKPPLLYILAAIAGSLFWFRATLAIWHLATIYIFWKLSTVLFEKRIKKTRRLRLQQVSTAIFALLTTLPLFEGNIANSELFMIGPIMLAFYILLAKKLNLKNLLSAGALFSIATLFKMPAAFDIPAIILYWLATEKLNKKNIKKISLNTVYLSIGFLIPILLTAVYYFLRGALFEYLVAAFLQNVGYLSSWRPSDVEKSFLARNLPLLTRAFIAFLIAAVVYWRRKKLSKRFIFLTLWLTMTLFAVTLSERPYPHYLVQSLPAVSYLIAILLLAKSLEQSLAILPLTLFFIVPVYFNFWRYYSLPYYANFYRFATGKISKEQYFSKFGKNVNKNYKIAETAIDLTNRRDKIFVWGDNSSIYALSRRLPPIKYVADYHIRDFSSYTEVYNQLSQNMPKLIIVHLDSPSFPQLTYLIRENYILVENIEGSTVWRLLNSDVRALFK
jgi:hypothetical protein